MRQRPCGQEPRAVGGVGTVDHAAGLFYFTEHVSDDAATPNSMAISGHTTPGQQSGCRSGGASSRTANHQTFGPEDERSHELGLKTDLLDHRVRSTLAGYKMDRHGSQADTSSIQTGAPGSFDKLVTIDAPGTTKTRGSRRT